MVASDDVALSLYVGVPLLSILISLVLSYWVYDRHWNRSGADAFVLTVLCGVVWKSFLIAHILSTDPTLQRVFVTVEGIFGFTTMVSFLIFISIYTGAGFHQRPFWKGLILTTVVGYALLSVTNPFHNYLFTAMPVRTEPFTYIETAVGPMFPVIEITRRIPPPSCEVRVFRRSVGTERRTGGG